ncbi:L,D-transpeptidase [Crenobacter sp. SG2303]|uniref:L,D-transpeptidase n=1 Tax=Crenobacter oryzisoli TaxID=3056844 RepID=A0ABT7XUQ6_9NEIS|nr:L,D-transpeptidase [Crenobacter sp. SG2303]MDN0077536.1 L,D-transpeptidase [Crenobacter sp. SG2303]
MRGLVWSRMVVGMLVGVLSLVARAQVPLPDLPVNTSGQHIVVNLPQTRLFVFQDGNLVASYPVAVGKMLTATPTGDYAIKGVYRDPSWHVPKSIQEEMRRKGKPVQTVVPPGPDNPLGPVFIRFGEPKLGLGMHGTNVPSSVPGFRSHGCVRLRNDDVLALASTVKSGASVTVAYQSVLLNEDSAGQLWLTAYHDGYKHKDVEYQALANALLSWQHSRGVAVFGKRVNEALKARNGKPVCLTCRHPDTAKMDGTLTVVRWQQPPAPKAVVPVTPAEPLMEPKPEASAAAPAWRHASFTKARHGKSVCLTCRHLDTTKIDGNRMVVRWQPPPASEANVPVTQAEPLMEPKPEVSATPVWKHARLTGNMPD